MSKQAIGEDLTEAQNIFNSSDNLKSFQDNSDDKANEHGLKLQTNTFRTDVRNHFPHTYAHSCQCSQQPCKVIQVIHDTIRYYQQGN